MFLLIFRYSSVQLPIKPTCKHKSPGPFKCNSLTMQDLVTFHNNFYKYPSKETQDVFLLNCCVPKKPTRKRPRKGNHKSKKFQTVFNVYSMMQKKKIRVCQTAFMGILHITKHRVQYIAKSFVEGRTSG